MRQLGSFKYSDTLVLASGDGDFKPVIEEAMKKTHNVEYGPFKQVELIVDM